MLLWETEPSSYRDILELLGILFLGIAFANELLTLLYIILSSLVRLIIFAWIKCSRKISVCLKKKKLVENPETQDNDLKGIGEIHEQGSKNDSESDHSEKLHESTNSVMVSG